VFSPATRRATAAILLDSYMEAIEDKAASMGGKRQNPRRNNNSYAEIKRQLRKAEMMAQDGDVAGADRIIRSLVDKKLGLSGADLSANLSKDTMRKLRAYSRRLRASGGEPLRRRRKNPRVAFMTKDGPVSFMAKKKRNGRYMTKAQFEAMFKEDVIPSILAQEQQYGSTFPDAPMRREAWNNMVDSYVRDGVLSSRAENWSHPSWLETYGFRKARRSARYY